MGCGASSPAQVKPFDANTVAVIPDGSKTQSVTSVEDSNKFRTLLEKPMIDQETHFHDSVQRMVAEYKRRSMGPDVFHIFEQALVGGVLEGCIFVGHVMTDLDSIGGAIGAAMLFGGTAARSEDDLNGEIICALKFAELEAPPHFASVPGGGSADAAGKKRNVCLVDHNEEKQMTPTLRDCPSRRDRIVGLIDHHAVSEAFNTERPPFLDVRPWGSMSSIVAHTFIREGIPITKSVARILLCAIISDTLNLRSVTTTRADRLMVAILAVLGELVNTQAVHDLATELFRAKTQWIVSLGPKKMVRGDQKDFTANGWRFGIAVLEVTLPDEVYTKAAELSEELRVLKKEKGTGNSENELHFAFCFIVDVTLQRSDLVLCGEAELELAKAAFPEAKPRATSSLAGTGELANGGLLDVGNLVSRKSQFAPAFLKTLNAGFTLSEDVAAKQQDISAAAKQQDITELSAAEIANLVDAAR